MRVHIESGTNKILGYYPEEFDYGSALPPESELIHITKKQHADATQLNATHFVNGEPVFIEDTPPPPPPVNERAQDALTVTLQNATFRALLEIQGIDHAQLLTQLSADFSHPEWSSETQYSIGDRVWHNRILWEATSNNINNEPDEIPGDWRKA